jgi:site-specific DNA recombinase
MHVDLYVRQSQDRDGLGLGVSRQEDDGLTLIRQRGWTLRRTHVENDTSAAGSKPRPKFEAMLADIEAGKVGAIVAWNLDRLTRNRRDTVRLIEVCQARGVVIALVRGSDLDMSTPAGRLTADVLAGVARHEIEQKSDRFRRAAEQAAQQGRRLGGRRPFGYDDDGMTIREDESAAIRAAYAAILSGVPLAAIARSWNEAGINTGKIGWKSGNPTLWTHDTVRRVMLNPRNAGLRRYRGEIVGKAAWPAIVAEETFHAAASVLQDPARRTAGPGRLGMRLLTGIARCGVCEQTVNSGGGARARRGYDIYKCRTMKHVVRQLDPVDAYVVEALIRRLSRSDAADLLVDQGRPNAEALRERAHVLRARLEGLAVEFAEEELTAAQLRAATARLREKLAAVEAEMADAGRVDVIGPLVRAHDKRAAWEALDPDRQRAAVNAVMVVYLLPPGRGKRTFDPETVRIEWR